MGISAIFHSQALHHDWLRSASSRLLRLGSIARLWELDVGAY